MSAPQQPKAEVALRCSCTSRAVSTVFPGDATQNVHLLGTMPLADAEHPDSVASAQPRPAPKLDGADHSTPSILSCGSEKAHPHQHTLRSQPSGQAQPAMNSLAMRTRPRGHKSRHCSIAGSKHA